MFKINNLQTLLLSVTAIPYIILAVYVLIMVGIAYYSRKKANTLDDFLLAGRGMGGWMTAFAYGTTYFSAVIFVGYAGKLGWAFGLSTVWIGIGNAVIGSLIAWLVLGKRTREMTHRLNVKTMPEFFKERYNSKQLKFVSAIIIFFFLIPYSASVYQGLGYTFEIIFGIKFLWCVILIAAITALYLFFGGYFATALTDFVQGIIMIIGVIIMVAVMVSKPEMSDFSSLSDKFGIIPSSISATGKVWDSPAFNIVIMVLLTSLGIWGLPQSVHKFYAIKDNAAIKKATIVSSLFALVIGGGAYFTGALSHLFVSNADFAAFDGNFDKIVPEMLNKNLPSALMGLILVLLLSASMSTLSSLSLSGSSAIVIDVYKGFIKTDENEKKINLMMKIICLVFIFVSAILAIFQFDAIVTLMGLSWGTIAGCFIGPYVWGLYNKKVTKQGAWASLIGTLVITFTLVTVFGLLLTNDNATAIQVIKAGISKSPLIGVICMFYSLIVTPIVSLFTKIEKEVVDKAFDVKVA